MYNILDSKHIKGSIGEIIVEDLIKSNCDIILIRNILIPYTKQNNSNSYLTEVDLIGINHFGIFLFEIKNICGEIFGGKLDKHWVAVYHSNNEDKSYLIDNPILQNEFHCDKLRKLLYDVSIHNIPLYSFILFTNSVSNLSLNSDIDNVFIVNDFINYYNNKFEAKEVLDDNLCNLLYKIFIELHRRYKLNQISNIINYNLCKSN